MRWIKQLLSFGKTAKKSKWNELPTDRIHREVMKHPWVRQKLIDISILQDQEGSHYHGIMNTLANDCVGPAPSIIGTSPDTKVNLDIEVQWQKYCQNNNIGASFRKLRRAAARTGLGIGIPYYQPAAKDPVKLGLKIISTRKLMSPVGATPNDRIISGIEYDINWDPVKIYLDTGESYEVKNILFWTKNRYEDCLLPVPECAPALCIFPSVQRFLDAIINTREFRASIPMAIKLDPLIWGKDAAEAAGMPSGNFKYEPGMVPTLPPGTTLEGLSYSGSTADDSEALDSMVGAAVRCINMPLNLATGNSSRHNMASSQVDFGPWRSTVLIDREDFSPPIHQFVDLWKQQAVMTEGYLAKKSVRSINNNGLQYLISSKQIFSHPDPLKNSNSLAVDLKSGAQTLSRYYTERGLNAEAELRREAQLLQMTYEEYCKLMMLGRVSESSLLLEDETPDEEEDQPTTVEKQ